MHGFYLTFLSRLLDTRRPFCLPNKYLVATDFVKKIKYHIQEKLKAVEFKVFNRIWRLLVQWKASNQNLESKKNVS